MKTPTDKRAAATAAPYIALATPRHDPPASPTSSMSPPSNSSSSSSSSPPRLVSLAQLFSFADTTDHVLMAVGTVASLVAGVSQPLQIVLIGDVMNAFRPKDLPPPAQLRADVNSVALNFVFVGLAVLVVCFLQVACWSLTASRQAKRLRAAYVAAILRQEIAWFDLSEPLQLSTRVADATVAIQEGMGRKVGDGLHFFSMGVSGIVIGLVKGWQLCLVLLAFAPLLGLTAFFFMRKLSEATQSGVASYATAGAVAQEALAHPRTVHMLNSIPHFVQKYATALQATTQAGIHKGLAVGAGIGVMYFVLYCTYAASMYYGAVLIANDQLEGRQCDGAGCYDGGKVMTVFFAVIMGAMALGQAGPSLQAVFTARTAAFDVFHVIHRRSNIDPTAPATDGLQLPHVSGAIALENVTFAYPSRPEIQVCQRYSLTIAPGETVALVGPSGSGKSTIVALLERFYDPQDGRVAIDNVDVKELNVKWLRAQIGLVGQEPALFAASIRENIRHGRPDATDEEVVEAARMANAYEFISAFPKGFETDVGERGTQLSGGQKQRIAIARAIIKNPPILLLDEATSALDTESERVVQESLDRLLATSNRTTIIIAHRLSTIRNADRIAVHCDGQIVEVGTHDELMAIPNGQYKTLVEVQSHVTEIEEVEGDEEVRRPLTTPQASSPATRKASRAKSHHSDAKGGNIEASSASVSSSDESSVDYDVPLSRVWQLTLPDWKFLVVGGVGGVVSAAVFPIWGVLLTKMIVLYFELDRTESQLLAAARQWSLGLLALGVVFCASITAQHYGFAVASQRLVARVREKTFAAMLSQEIGWFDLDANASGALVARLATDSATLHALTADTLNQGLVNVTTLGIGLAIAFYYSWQMTLVNLAILPLFGFTVMIQTRQYAGTLNNRENNTADLSAGALLSEAIGAIRTVASFSMETVVTSTYVGFVDVSKKTDMKVGIVGGLTFGVAQALMFFNLALLFHVGGRFVADGTVAFNDMFMVMLVLVLSLFPIGMAAQNATDSAKAKRAASSVFQILDRTPHIDSMADDGHTLDEVHGELAFRSVQFAYPSRPDQAVYRDYNLRVEPGQTVALVGASGSGKSTAIALLERFYNPLGGSVTLDGADLRTLSLPWLRDRIALVSQEPVLFAGTIAENIAMGKPGATRNEIEDAARKANAFGFISNFPRGLDTDVGDRGAQVSGGQKQRIAIARAILRDPSVLLLDEATSALDNESERVVQQSLDELVQLKRRTTIIVAHRLSTIRNADLIAVTKDGAIVEQGTHDELMAIERGVYKALVARQMASATATPDAM